MASYSSRHSKPLGGGRHAFGGPGLNLDVAALIGEAEVTTVFDDFNQRATLAGAGANTPLDGWTATDVTGVAGTVGVNDEATGIGFPSSVQVVCGATADGGLNLQIVGNTENDTMYYDDDVPPTAMDNRVFTFACRIGLSSNIGATWNHKAFIGFAGNPDVDVMTPATGALITPADNSQIGFHIAEDGHVDFVSRRVGATVLVAGTNFTPVFPAGTIDYTAANTPVWLDLCFQVNTRDISDNANNGTAQAFVRRVPLPGGAFGTAGAQKVGATERYASDGANTQSWDEEWTQTGATLINQNPFPSAAGGDLVPTLEVLNGPTGAGNQCTVFLDWWAIGTSRVSRRREP